MRKMHLDKNGTGMTSRTACGRNILRTPMSAKWAEFKQEKPEHQCDKCANSAHAAFYARSTK